MKKYDVLYFLVVKFNNEPISKFRYLFKLGNAANMIELDFADSDEHTTLQKALADGFNPVINKQHDIKTGIIRKQNDIQDIIVEGKYFPELLAFENVSLWQFITGVIYNSYMQDVIELIEYVTTLIDEHKPRMLYVVGNISDYQQKTIELISTHRNVSVRYFTNQTDRKMSINKISGVLKSLCRYVLKSIKMEGYVIEMLLRFRKRSPIGKVTDRFAIRDYALSLKEHKQYENTVLLVSFPRVWEKKGTEEIDQYYDVFKKTLTEKGLMPIRIESPYYFQIPGDVKEYIHSTKKGKRGGFTTLLFDEYYNEDIKNESLSYLSHFEDIFKKLESSDSFLHAFSWKGISFFSPLYSYWKSLFTEFVVEAISSLLVARNMLQELRPKAVFVLYEVGQYSRAMIIEAHRSNVPSIGLQHGMNSSRENEYLQHKNQSTDPDLQKGYYGFIAPNKTFVYGEYGKEVLTRYGYYPEHSIVKVGNWRYLNVDYKSIHLVSRKFREEWFSKDKVALLLTSAFATDIAYIIFKKLDPSVYSILIKLHPDDKNSDFYEKLFASRNFEIHVTKQHLFESIHMADLIFAPLYTSVIFDCLAMGKPVFYAKNFDLGLTVPQEGVLVDMQKVDDFEKAAKFFPKEKARKLLSDLGVDISIDVHEFTETINSVMNELGIN